jgi:DNA-binding MarR family transcriptional regulator
VERKGLVKRNIGKDDKRQMYFSLTDAGKMKLGTIKCEEFDIPEMLKTVIEV